MRTAIQILRKEIDRIAGELFSEELTKRILQQSAEYGDEESARKLKMGEFVDRLMGKPESFDNNPKAQAICDLVEAIRILAEQDKGD